MSPTGHAMPDREMHTNTGLEIAGPRQVARLMGRVVRLRCPNCGGGPVLEHWLRMRVRCGACGLRLRRGEHDNVMGPVMFSFTIAGVLLFATLAVLLVNLREVPWDAIQYGGPVAMIVLLVLLFPFSRLVWLAFDLMLRPVTPAEMEWHRAAPGEFSDEGRRPPG